MNEHIDRHAPTPEFRSRLETEVSRTLRSEQRSRVRRWLGSLSPRTASRLAAAILVGVVVGAAPAQVADARQRDSLLIVANAELRLAMMRLAIAQEEQERTAKLFASGVVTERELRAAQRGLHELQMRLETIQLNMRETRASAAAARNDLGAPLVGQHDYVKDRLMLELRAKQQELLVAEQAARETEQRVRTGVETATAKFAAEAELAKVQSEMELMAAKLRLREEFVAGRAEAGTLEQQLRVLELRQQLRVLQLRQRLAEERLAIVRDQVSMGAVTRRESLRAELEADELQVMVEMLMMQLRRMEAGR